jgi:hypothetical protein
VPELVLVGVVLIAAGALFTQGLGVPADYDEGSYLAAVDALRHGQALGSEVFSPQPPAFYSLLVAGDAVLGNSLRALRIELIALALLGCLGAYLVGRLVAGRWAGLGAAALLAVAHPYSTFAGKISADLPAVVLGLLALAALLGAGRLHGSRWSTTLAGASGALIVASVLVKLSLLSLVAPVVALALQRPRLSRRDGAAALGGALLVALSFVAAYHSDLHGIWRGAVSYHSAARGVSGPGTTLSDNLSHYVHFFDPRTRNALVWLAPLGALAWLALAPRVRLRLAPLWAWALLCLALLLAHRPLHDNHDVLLAGSLGLVAGASVGAALAALPRREALVGAGLIAAVLAMGYVKEFRDLHGARASEPAEVRWAVERLRERTRPVDLVATDRPIIAFLAGRRMPGDLVDTAYLRFRSGYLTPEQVLADIDRSHVQAVVTARAFRDQPRILAGLRVRFPAWVRLRSGDVTLYLRSAASR